MLAKVNWFGLAVFTIQSYYNFLRKLYAVEFSQEKLKSMMSI